MIKLGGEDSKPPKPETDPGWEERLAEHKAKRQRLLLEAGSSVQHGAQAAIEGRFPVKDTAN